MQNTTPVVQEPLTAKDRVVGALVALVFLGLAASMIRWPVLPVSSGDVSASRTRGVVTVVELIWSRPVGVVLGLLGLFLIWSSLTAGARARARADRVAV